MRGPFRPQPGIFAVPGDPSSAAFFAVLGALRPSGAQTTIRRVLVNPTRTGFLDVLKRMGVAIQQTSPTQADGLLESICDLTVSGGAPLHAVHTMPQSAPAMIDEIPILAVAALFAHGTSRFCGLSELRVKESDRLGKTIELVKTAGGHAWTEGDDLCVEGMSYKGQAFQYNPAKDHRLAMAAAVLGKQASEPSVIFDPQCVDVSFPGFFEILSLVDC